jgi:hypothetical protein
MDGENIGLNPNDFCLSSSGLQFVSNTPVNQYKVVELTFSMNAASSNGSNGSNGNNGSSSNNGSSNSSPAKLTQVCNTVNCSGMVVDCCKDPDCGSYKISLYFLDIPENVKNQIVTRIC